jgi:PAS domain S-box-containing protein
VVGAPHPGDLTAKAGDEMSWIQVAWVMMIAASLMLGVVHLFVWQKQRSQYADLLFFVLAVSAAAYGAYELARMQAESPADFAVNARWSHVPLAMFVISVVGFVRLYFDAGRLWLAYTVIGVRLAALALNFLTGVNVNFREITALDQLQFWGGAVVVGPVGIPNPWAIVPQLGNLLLVVFIVDASISLWRRGGAVARRRAALVGGSLALCILAAAGVAALVVTGVVHAPTVLMPGFFIVVLAMGYELVWDLTAAAQLAAQLRASEERFRAVVEAAPSAILLVDDRGMIALANAQAETLFGYPREELIAMPVERLIPEHLRAPHTEQRTAYAGDARAMGAGGELLARRKDGGGTPVEVALSSMPTERGNFVLASVVDITERRRVERMTARQRDELAHLSRVAMLGELSGSLAHELNQPLTAILSNAQAAQRFLAQDPPRVDKLAEILTDIVKSDQRAGAVIQRLRSLLRKEDAQCVPLDTNEVIEDSLRLMRSDFLYRHVTVSTDLAEALPAVSGDRNQLQQVLLNLVINACDAMDGQETDRRLMVRTQTTAHGDVEVCVVDRGMGIPEANLDRIFEPFVTTKATGMGLGLAICKSIVEAHGGRLWATNNADCGATLHCELPAKRS